jgi:hypothetical protein
MVSHLSMRVYREPPIPSAAPLINWALRFAEFY